MSSYRRRRRLRRDRHGRPPRVRRARCRRRAFAIAGRDARALDAARALSGAAVRVARSTTRGARARVRGARVVSTARGRSRERRRAGARGGARGRRALRRPRRRSGVRCTRCTSATNRRRATPAASRCPARGVDCALGDLAAAWAAAHVCGAPTTRRADALRDRAAPRLAEDRPLDEVAVSYVFDDLVLSAGEPARACSRALGTRAASCGGAIAGSRAPAAERRRVNAGARDRRRARRRSSFPGGDVDHGAAPRRGARGRRRSCRRRAARRATTALRPARARAAARAEARDASCSRRTRRRDDEYARTRFAVVAQARRGFSARAGRRARARSRTRRPRSIAAWVARAARRARARGPLGMRAPSELFRAEPALRELAGRSAGSSIEPSFAAWYQRSMTMSWQLEAEAPVGPRRHRARGIRLGQRPRPDRGGRPARADRRAPDLVPRRLAPRAPGRDRHGAPVRAPDVRPDRVAAAGRVRPARSSAPAARSNAATWVDWTYYRLSLPARDLALGVRLEAERMQHLVLEHDAGRGRARRRDERAPRARRGRRRRLARRAADGARVHGAPVSLADDRLDGGHPRARAARHPRVLPDVVRAEQRDDRVRRRLRRARAARR